MNVGTDELECWFLTGSQHLYGKETLREVAAQSAEVVAALDTSPEIPVRIVSKPVLTGSEEIRQVCLAGKRHPELHRRDRLDAHVLTGQGLDRGTGGAAAAASASTHAGQLVACRGTRSTWTS